MFLTIFSFLETIYKHGCTFKDVVDKGVVLHWGVCRK